MSPLKDIATRYFEAFALKDSVAFAALLADDVVLRDWDQAASGIAAVLAVNQAIFNAAQSLSVTPILLVEEGSVLVAELEILINGAERLRVVDILVFNADKKICRVSAYKG